MCPVVAQVCFGGVGDDPVQRAEHGGTLLREMPLDVKGVGSPGRAEKGGEGDCIQPFCFAEDVGGMSALMQNKNGHDREPFFMRKRHKAHTKCFRTIAE